MNSQIIDDFLHNYEGKILESSRRTRGGTKKLLDNYKIELKSEEKTKDSKTNFVYFLNEKIISIQIDDGEEIVEVSCGECVEEFCIHRRILLTKISQTLKTEESSPSPELTRKRKISSKSGTANKRMKLETENDSSLMNIPSNLEVHEEIVLKKTKKIPVEVPQGLLKKAEVLKMENLMKSFYKGGSFKEFHDHCVKIMTENSEAIQIANDLTVDQADTTIWHELRIGRVTASRLHEMTRCTMKNGSLVDKVMGKKSGWSFAMMRGTILEDFVFKEVKKEFPTLARSGLIMNHKVNPFFAASPDGIHEDFVLEIKCPNTQNTFETYIDVNKLSKKYFAQIQLQMYVTGQKKALLAVASLDFEKTRNITKIWIPLDEEYINEMIQQAEEFYEKAIFPALKRKFLR